MSKIFTVVPMLTVLIASQAMADVTRLRQADGALRALANAATEARGATNSTKDVIPETHSLRFSRYAFIDYGAGIVELVLQNDSDNIHEEPSYTVNVLCNESPTIFIRSRKLFLDQLDDRLVSRNDITKDNCLDMIKKIKTIGRDDLKNEGPGKGDIVFHLKGNIEGDIVGVRPTATLLGYQIEEGIDTYALTKALKKPPIKNE